VTARAGARAPGRPRSAASERAILRATIELVGEFGFDGATTDAIAARAGVSKATIYRRWSTKDELVLAAVTSIGHEVRVPDTGSLESDLRALVGGLVAVFADERFVPLVPMIVDQMARKPPFRAAMQGGFIRLRREVALEVLRRAQERGEIDVDGADLAFAQDLLAAPLYYRVLVSGDRVDDALADQIVWTVIAWLTRGDAAAGGERRQGCGS
jgi:AcrR family transcriptional regulator